MKHTVCNYWRMEALQRAIDHFGNQSALARAIGVTPQMVTNWKDRGIPAEQAVKIEHATSGAITVRELRPDLYPQDAA